MRIPRIEKRLLKYIMLLIAEVGGEGRCIKLDKIFLGLKKFRRVDPDLRGNNARWNLQARPQS